MHWATIFRNMFSNASSYVVSAVVGFLLTPVVVHALGNTGYGLWTLVLSLTGYFGLLDLGIRSSVGRFVARYVALRDDANINGTVSTALLTLACGSALILVLTAAMVVGFFPVLKVEPEFYDAARIALLITGVNMACTLPLGIFSSVLIAVERFDVLSGITIVGELTRAVLVAVFLSNGYGLIAVALIAMGVNLGQYAVMAVFTWRLQPNLRIGWRWADRRTFHDVFGFAVYRFVWTIGNQLIFYSSSIVIAAFLGASSITFYALAVSVIGYGRNILSLVCDTFYPAATRMDAKDDRSGLRHLFLIGTRISLMIAVPLCLGFLFLGRDFLTLWMGKNYASSAVYLSILTVAQFVSMSQYVTALVLAGMARHRILAYLALAEGVANVGLSVWLIQSWGLAGVAWAAVIPSVILTGIVVPAYILRLLNVRLGEYLRVVWLRPLLCGVPAAAAGYAAARRSGDLSWAVFAAEAAAIVAVFAVFSYFVCLDGYQRAQLSGKIAAVFNRERLIHEA